MLGGKGGEMLPRAISHIPGDIYLEKNHLGKTVLAGILGLACLILLFGSFTTVDPGKVGIAVTLGYVSKAPWEPGLHWKLPLVTSVVEMSTRLEKHPVNAPAASKDLQQVTAEVTVPFSLKAESGPDVFQRLGMQETFQSTLIDPGVMESVKAITAQFTAEELVTQRETVKAKIEDQIKSYVREALAQKGLAGAIEIGNVAITHFDFSKDFNDSIEAKVKAEQDALRAENEKKQKVTQAEAERDSQKAKADGSAYSIEVQSKAEAAAIQRKADALRANPNLVQLNAVDKWDGKMPQYLGGQTPIPFLGVPTK
jgi:regulator of protease activity HflC (stomatin/prohibitin superfamily)